MVKITLMLFTLHWMKAGPDSGRIRQVSAKPITLLLYMACLLGRRQLELFLHNKYMTQKHVMKSCIWLCVTINMNLLYSLIQSRTDHCGQDHTVSNYCNHRVLWTACGKEMFCLHYFHRTCVLMPLKVATFL